MTDTSLLYTIFAVDKASTINDKVGSSVSKLALGISVAAGAIAAKTTVMAGNFQAAMTRLTTSAGESAANIKADSAGVLALAGPLGDSAQQLSGALYTINSGGQHGAAGLVVLKAAAQGAKAEGADLTTVSDALTSVLQDYHEPASDAALVTSKLVAATGAGKQTFEQLAGSLSSVLPVASAAHISLNDILAAEASMTVHGMSADQVTQNLADTIRHMQNPTQVQSKELAQLGIKASDLAAMLGTKGLTGTLSYVSETILSKMGPSGKVLLGTFTQSQQAAEDVKTMVASMPKPLQDLANQFINNKITASDWRSALKDLAPDQQHQMQQFATLQKNATGFTQALATGSPAAQSYSAALAKAMGDSTGLNTALMLTGENTTYVNGAIKQISSATTEAGGNVAGWSTIQDTFNQRMSEAKATVEVLGIRIGTVLLPYAQKAVDVTMDAVQWFTKHKTTAQALAIGIGILAGAVLLYKGYMLAANVATKAATVAQALWKGALMVSRGAVYAFNAAMYIARSVIWEWVAGQAASLAGWVANTAATIANTTVLIASKVAMVAVSAATKAWAVAQWLLNAAMTASPVTLIIIAVLALAAGIWYLWTHSSGFRDFMIKMWHDIWDVLKAIGSWFAGPFVDFWKSGYHWVITLVTDICLWIHDKVELAKLILSTMWDTAVAKVTEAALWIHSKWESVITFVRSIPARIRSAATGMWDGVKDEFRGAVNWVIGKWDGLKFTIPAVSFLGVHSPAFTLAVPHIPMLAKGGIVKAKPGGTVAVLGEAGQDEMVTPLPRGGAGGGRQVVHVHVHVVESPAVAEAMRQDLAKVIRTRFDGDVDAALAGGSL